MKSTVKQERHNGSPVITQKINKLVIRLTVINSYELLISLIKNNNNYNNILIYKAPYGRNFRGAGGMVDRIAIRSHELCSLSINQLINQ